MARLTPEEYDKAIEQVYDDNYRGPLGARVYPDEHPTIEGLRAVAMWGEAQHEQEEE